MAMTQWGEPVGSGVKYRLSPVRTVNNCHRASLKIMLYLAKQQVTWCRAETHDLAGAKPQAGHNLVIQ